MKTFVLCVFSVAALVAGVSVTAGPVYNFASDTPFTPPQGTTYVPISGFIELTDEAVAASGVSFTLNDFFSMDLSSFSVTSDTLLADVTGGIVDFSLSIPGLTVDADLLIETVEQGLQTLPPFFYDVWAFALVVKGDALTGSFHLGPGLGLAADIIGKGDANGWAFNITSDDHDLCFDSPCVSSTPTASADTVTNLPEPAPLAYLVPTGLVTVYLRRRKTA